MKGMDKKGGRGGGDRRVLRSVGVGVGGEESQLAAVPWSAKGTGSHTLSAPDLLPRGQWSSAVLGTSVKGYPGEEMNMSTHFVLGSSD